MKTDDYERLIFILGKATMVAQASEQADEEQFIRKMLTVIKKECVIDELPAK